MNTPLPDKSHSVCAKIHNLLKNPLSGERIEQMSFECIDRECINDRFSTEEWIVVRRMIHTCGDLSIADGVRFSGDAIESAKDALVKGCSIYADSSMIKAGLSLSRLQAVNGDYTKDRVITHIGDKEVAQQARDSGLPRSLFAVRKAREILHGGIVVFGNAPVALMELNRMIIEDGIRPALVVAMPVGFIHVIESKIELTSLNVPFITIDGRRGGSPLAVAVIHALCNITASKAKKVDNQSVRGQKPKSAIIIIGHGSRVPEAANGMERVADVVRNAFPEHVVSACYMSLNGPRLNECFLDCISKGVENILVMPYFLHKGVHLQCDIPEMLQQIADPYPQVKVVLGDCLGYDDMLASVVLKRIGESNQLSDIRQFTIPDEKIYQIGN